MKLESGKWYRTEDHKLEADEIQGRIVIEGRERSVELYRDLPPNEIVEFMYGKKCFGQPAISYMLIDPPDEEPMMLDGLNPQIINISDNQWLISYSCGARNFYFYGSTRSEAIHNANEFIRRVK